MVITVGRDWKWKTALRDEKGDKNKSRMRGLGWIAAGRWDTWEEKRHETRRMKKVQHSRGEGSERLQKR